MTTVIQGWGAGGPAAFARWVESGTGADLGKDHTSSVGCVEFKVPMGQPCDVPDTTGRQAKRSEVTSEVEAEGKTSVARPHPRESHTVNGGRQEGWGP